MKITESGSYKLSVNLIIPTGTNGIEIRTSEVTVDCNGFTIARLVLMSGGTIARHNPASMQATCELTQMELVRSPLEQRPRIARYVVFPVG